MYEAWSVATRRRRRVRGPASVRDARRHWDGVAGGGGCAVKPSIDRNKYLHVYTDRHAKFASVMENAVLIALKT